MRSSVKKSAYIGLMLAVALITSVIEGFIPPLIPLLPMIKFGLSNVVILFTYIVFGGVPSYIVLLLRCFFVAVFSGNFFMLAYSIPAGVISLSIGIIMLKSRRNSVIMVSATEAVIHNIVQVFIATLVMNTSAVFIYLPYLILLGGLSGMVTGFIAELLIKKLPNKIFLEINKL